MKLNECCDKFPAPTTRFEEIGISIERQAALYKCRICGNLIELPEMERSIKLISVEEAARYYEINQSNREDV
jgi:hypothetical protein